MNKTDLKIQRELSKEQGFYDGRFAPRVIKNKKKEMNKLLCRKNKLKSHYKVIALLFIISAGLLSYSILLGDTKQKSKDKQTTDQQTQFRYAPNDAYGFGEHFEYDIKYSFIKAGEGTIQIMPKPIIKNNRECYDVRFEARSLKSLEFLYKVLDKYRSAIDVSGLFPWEFEQIIREGNYKRDFKAYFDQVGNFAYANKKMYKTPPYVHDVISAFYYVRSLNLSAMKKGEIIQLKNFWDDSTYSLGVKILGKTEVEVPAGKFRCVVVEPVDIQGGLFRNTGKIFIYLTDDERKMPVKVASKILIGEVMAELTSYSGLRGPVKAKLD